MKPFNRLRLFHGLFVLTFLAVYFSGDDGELLHIWLGYGLVALIAIRLLLALIRAKGFPTLWPSFRTAAPITASRLLVMGLFLSAGITLATGLMMVDNARILGVATTAWIAPAHADDDGVIGSGDEDQLFSSEIEELHEIAANATWTIAAIHVGFLLAFRRRFALNMIPGFGPAAKSGSGPVSKPELASRVSAASSGG